MFWEAQLGVVRVLCSSRMGDHDVWKEEIQWLSKKVRARREKRYSASDFRRWIYA